MRNESLTTVRHRGKAPVDTLKHKRCFLHTNSALYRNTYNA